jgi:hypothetical protein
MCMALALGNLERPLALRGAKRSPSAKLKQLLDDTGWRATVRRLVQRSVERLAAKT